MIKETLQLGEIPAILWGPPSDRLFIHVHGKMSRKEYAENFALIAEEKGYQTLSFDLPGHGERQNSTEPCDVWTGIRDLNIIADAAFACGRQVSLYACSLGAYFSLNAYTDRPFRQCLFQSPIVDMEETVRMMMRESGVTEQELQEKQKIDTPIDTLRWDYYRYILAHPVTVWPRPTAVLYGALDDLQSLSAVRSFAERFGAALTVAPNSRHPFMAPEDAPIVEAWIRESILP